MSTEPAPNLLEPDPRTVETVRKFLGATCWHRGHHWEVVEIPTKWPDRAICRRDDGVCVTVDLYLLQRFFSYSWR